MGPQRLTVDEPRELPGGLQLIYNRQDLPQTKKQGDFIFTLGHNLFWPRMTD